MGKWIEGERLSLFSSAEYERLKEMRTILSRNLAEFGNLLLDYLSISNMEEIMLAVFFPISPTFPLLKLFSPHDINIPFNLWLFYK